MEEFVSRCSYDDSLRVGNENHRRGGGILLILSRFPESSARLSSYPKLLGILSFIIIDCKTRSGAKLLKYCIFFSYLFEIFCVLLFYVTLTSWFFFCDSIAISALEIPYCNFSVDLNL